MRNLLAMALSCIAFVHLPSSAQHGNSHLTAPLIHVDQKETPVHLESASVVVEPGAGMARTTINMVFRNPNETLYEVVQGDWDGRFTLGRPR